MAKEQKPKKQPRRYTVIAAIPDTEGDASRLIAHRWTRCTDINFDRDYVEFTDDLGEKVILVNCPVMAFREREEMPE